MVVTYRNNRLFPALIIAACIAALFFLIDPSIENYGNVKTQQLQPQHADHSHEDAPPPLAQAPPPPSQSPVSRLPVEGGFVAQQDDDVLLIMKTGGTSMWKRLLVHLTTTLAPERVHPSNMVIYSDMAETVGPFEIVDVFANMSDAVKASEDFHHYRAQPEYRDHNAYVEAAGVEGDDWGPPGGWVIDKYKFLPLVRHAGERWPGAKWYVYMEDDTYLFLPSVKQYLARFDAREKHYLGSYAAKTGVVFAHGGAGFALSRGAWEAVFASKESESGEGKEVASSSSSRLEDEYHQYATDHCCGDQVLAKALHDHGVSFGENGGDEKFTWGFNPLVHWAFPFSRYNWCSPLLSWHKVHNRDVAQYFALESRWDFASKPLLHRDFFHELVLPRVREPRQWWDNRAELFEVTSANQAWGAKPEGSKFDEAKWKMGWESVGACEAACRGWEACVSWTYVEDLCKMDDKVTLGQGYAPDMSQRKTSLMHTSGWLPERMEAWLCDWS